MRFYGDISKVDAEERMVWGYASTETTDAAGEVILKSAIEDALADYMAFANIREMHQLSAVGTATEANVDDKGLYIGAHIVDDAAWAKVTAGVYKGFSIGGKVAKRDPKKPKTITKLRLSEISLVDRPCNAEATFDVWKAAGTEESDMADAMATETNEADEAAKAVAVAQDGQEPDSATEGTAERAAAADEVKGEDAPKPDDAVADEAAKADEAPDAAERASAAVEALEAAVAKAATAGDLSKGMYEVSRLADILSSIAYVVSECESEAVIEADNSPVPAKLRSWLVTGAALLKELAAEEIDEFMARVSTRKAEAGAAVTSGQDAEKLAKAEADREDLTKRLAERDEALAKLAERVEPLAKTVETLASRLKAVEEAPLPPKTAGAAAAKPVVIEKAADAAGSGATTSPSALSEEDVRKALDAMPEDQRAFIVTKAALSRPILINR